MGQERRAPAPSDGPETPLLEALLGVHSAQTRGWLADACATAAERGLGALYGLLYLLDASGRLCGVRPASSARRRGLAALKLALEADPADLRFDPQGVPLVRQALSGDRLAVAAGLDQALILPQPSERIASAQRALGIDAAWLAPLHWDGDSSGLLLLLMPANAQAAPALAELLARHAAVAFANLQEEERARRRGELDAVLWVYDERRFMEQLAQEVRRAERHKHPLSILLVRVENIEALRARYGRFLADWLLRQLAGRLADAMRDSDFLGAFREDGFAMILVEADAEAATRAADRLLAPLDGLDVHLPELSDLELRLDHATATLGPDGATADELVDVCEARLGRGEQRRDVA
jgi:diguanylate cyclase (GGDEF)-like protein